MKFKCKEGKELFDLNQPQNKGVHFKSETLQTDFFERKSKIFWKVSSLNKQAKIRMKKFCVQNYTCQNLRGFGEVFCLEKKFSSRPKIFLANYLHGLKPSLRGILKASNLRWRMPIISLGLQGSADNFGCCISWNLSLIYQNILFCKIFIKSKWHSKKFDFIMLFPNLALTTLSKWILS